MRRPWSNVRFQRQDFWLVYAWHVACGHARHSYPVIWLQSTWFVVLRDEPSTVESLFGRYMSELMMVLAVPDNQWDKCAAHWKKSPNMNYVMHLFADASAAIMEWCRSVLFKYDILLDFILIVFTIYLFDLLDMIVLRGIYTLYTHKE